MLRDTYPKLRAYLARLSLLLATCREIEEDGDSEVTRDDVERAAKILDYFEATARKAFMELYSSDRDAKNAFELIQVLNACGNSKSATAAEWRKALPSAPDTPEATSKLLRKIARSTPRLSLEDGYRGKERLIKISLIEKLSEPSEPSVDLASEDSEEDDWVEID